MNERTGTISERAGTTSEGSKREELLMQIRRLGFVLYDLILFLDTHPQDEDAMALYEEHLQKYKEITKEFAGLYGPLTAFDENNGKDTCWSWGQASMPWEGGC